MSNKIFSAMSTNFESFDNTIQTYLTKSFDGLGIQVSNSQIFNIIFKGIKGVMQNIMLYIEDALTEQNIQTATRKKSIYSLAKISGYNPYYGCAASGNLIGKVFITNGVKNISNKIYIDNHQEITNTVTGVVYSIILNTNKYVFDISAPLVNHEFKIVQGTFKTAQYVSTGEPLERVSVNISNLFDIEYVDVFVNGEKWECVSSLYDMYDNSHTYIIETGYENTFDIIFGNGIYGHIPEDGSTINIQFLTHSGNRGNIGLNEEAVFKFTNSGYDSFGNNVNINDFMKLYVSNVISGGTDSDSIEFVREMIGTNSRSNVLASEDNFRLFFKRFSFIGGVKCWSDTNSMIINAVCTSKVISNIKEYDDYYKISPNSLMLSDNHKEMITHTLNNSNKGYAGLTLKLNDPIIRQYAINCYIKTSNAYSRNTVKQDISNAFAKYFCSISDNTQFIAKSDLITIGLKSSDEIEAFDIDIISEMAETAYKQGYYYEYKLKLINGTYKYVAEQVFYEKDETPGLDNYGNIQIKSNLEIPMLHGGFKYYPNKDTNDKKTNITVDAIQFFFI